jgi:hydrogenase-1 operon protein HyaF
MKPEATAPCLTTLCTGMANAVLSEISDRLGVLADTGEPSVVNLRGLPMTVADLKELEESLGRGEVSVSLEVAGASEIWETRYSGVWWVRHLGTGGQVATEEIAVTPFPEILRAHTQDIQAAAARIREDTGSPGRNENEQEASNG